MDELEKIYQDFVQKRKMITSTIPSGSGSIISGGAIGFDFDSLYPDVRKSYEIKQMIRRRKIERIFKNPS